MDVLKDYNLILKEREARKKFIFEKNMYEYYEYYECFYIYFY